MQAEALVQLSEEKGRLRPTPPLLPPPLGARYSASRVSNLESIALYCVVAAAARTSCTMQGGEMRIKLRHERSVRA